MHITIIEEEIILETYNIYGEEGKEVISGVFERFDTCLFPLARESNEPKGTFTAEEVADFLNKKMRGERFGFVYVKDDGNKIEWYDDSPYNVEIMFKKLQSEEDVS